jgi:VanZ family protein
LRFRFSILKYQLPAFLWAIFIFVLCTTSQGGFRTQKLFGIPTDKLGHTFIFAVLVFFIMLGLIKYWRFSFLLRKIRIVAFSIAVLYAIFIEIFQHFFTVDRVADYWDIVADIIGSALGWLMFYSVYGNLKFLDKE